MFDITGRMMNKSPLDNCLPPPIFTLLSAVLTHVHTALINFPSLEYGTHERKQIIQLCVYDVVNGTGDEHVDPEWRGGRDGIQGSESNYALLMQYSIF